MIRNTWCAYPLLSWILSAPTFGQQPNSPVRNLYGQPSTLLGNAPAVRAAVRTAVKPPWRYNGFRVVQNTGPGQVPWKSFFPDQDGYVALYLEPSKEIPNTGKGGGARGTRHPEFSVWLVPNTSPRTRREMEASIVQHQMMQEDLPTVCGSNGKYVLAVVGDLDDAEATIQRIAAALNIPLSRNCK